MKKKIVIGISATIGSGKDTVANYLVDHYHFKKLSFAESLKDSLSVIFGWDRQLLEGITKESREWREQVDIWWSNKLNIPNFTPRYAMQHIGTNLFRKHFNDNIWINSLERKILNTNTNVVITDVRFENEFNMVKNINGIMIRIFRGIEPEWINIIKNDFEKFKSTYPDIHPSEYSSVNLNYDYYINNNYDYENLYGQIREIIVRNRF